MSLICKLINVFKLLCAHETIIHETLVSRSKNLSIVSYIPIALWIKYDCIHFNLINGEKVGDDSHISTSSNYSLDLNILN